MTDSGQRRGLCSKWAWHMGCMARRGPWASLRPYGRSRYSLACSTNGSCQPPSTKNRICRALPSLRCCFPFFHLYFCTSRNAFNMKRQQARTGSAIRREREREGDRDIGRTGEALRCQPSQAKLRQAGRQAGWQGWQGQCPSERLKRCQRWLFASSGRQARRACGCG